MMGDVSLLSVVARSAKIPAAIIGDQASKLPKTVAGFSKRLDVVNLTNENINIGDRFGTVYVLEPANNRANISAYRGVYFYETYTVGDQVKIDTSELSMSSDPRSTPEYQDKLREALLALADSREAGTFKRKRTDSFTLREHVTTEMLKSKGGLYLPSSDLIVSFTRSTEKYYHPESTEARRIIRRVREKAYSFDYKVVIVDPEFKVGDMWINVNGLIFKVVTVKDNEKDEGIYLTTSGTDMETIHYSFEEGIEKLRLYKTEDDARRYGDLKSELDQERIREIENLKFEGEKQKMNNQRELNQLTTELERSKAQQQLLESQLKRQDVADSHLLDKDKQEREERAAQRKYEYDMKSMDRKDSSEIIKWIPAMITGIASMLLLTKGLK